MGWWGIVTYRNISSQQQTAPSGYFVFADRESGKQYTVNQPVTIMADGWGLYYEQVSPQSTFSTKLAYKFPTNREYELFYALHENTFFALGSFRP